MTIRITWKTIVVAVAILLLGGIITVHFISHKKPKGTDWKAVAQCQQEVTKTYQSLTDTSDLIAPKTTSTIQTQEQDAKNNCVTENTH